MMQGTNFSSDSYRYLELLIEQTVNEGAKKWNRVLGCGSFVRGRKRKKGDSIPFILSRRDYM